MAGSRRRTQAGDGPRSGPSGATEEPGTAPASADERPGPQGEPGGPPGPGAGVGPGLETRNEVTLVGRVPAEAQERELPSGDVIVVWRLVVDRPPGRRPGTPPGRPVTIDTLDCTAWSARTRRTARTLVAGDVVEVHGALRRRFWRGGTGAVSRCEVEVATVRRLQRAPA